MTGMHINSLSGRISPDDLGATLMHEHLMVGFPAWHSNTLAPGFNRKEMIRICCDKVQALQDRNIRTILDPCPNDLGRDIAFSAEVAARTGFNIICATGLYVEDAGAAAYWKIKGMFEPLEDLLTSMFIRELTVGIGDTDIRAGVIKVATGAEKITDYESTVLRAAARASLETGAPITTHTDAGSMGPEQLALLTECGVAPHKIIIGHCCGSSDPHYHNQIVTGGAYIGFDRFGYNMAGAGNDEDRIRGVLELLKAGRESQIILSHDSVWCDLGQLVPPSVIEAMPGSLYPEPTFLSDVMIPRLIEAGANPSQIDVMLTENPKRYFTGNPP